MTRPLELPRKSHRAVLPGCAALLLFFAPATFAQVTGKVIGTVTDGDTGQPLVGAQVMSRRSGASLWTTSRA